MNLKPKSVHSWPILKALTSADTKKKKSPSKSFDARTLHEGWVWIYGLIVDICNRKPIHRTCVEDYESIWLTCDAKHINVVPRDKNLHENWVAKRSLNAPVYIYVLCKCCGNISWLFGLCGVAWRCYRLHSELKNAKCQTINQSHEKLLLDVFVVLPRSLSLSFFVFDFVMHCSVSVATILHNAENVIKQRLMNVLHAVRPCVNMNSSICWVKGQ